MITAVTFSLPPDISCRLRPRMTYATRRRRCHAARELITYALMPRRFTTTRHYDMPLFRYAAAAALIRHYAAAADCRRRLDACRHASAAAPVFAAAFRCRFSRYFRSFLLFTPLAMISLLHCCLSLTLIITTPMLRQFFMPA